MGKDDMSDIALALEEQAKQDDWFVSRSLHPNIDYWTAIVFYTLGFPQDMFPVWMMIPRVSGFIAHWQESLDDPEYKIYRPRQIYTGVTHRKYIKDRFGIYSPSLTGYLPSDPQATLRRTASLGPRTQAELLSLINRTEEEIQRVKQEIASLEGGSPDGQAETSEERPGDSTKAFPGSAALNWITGHFSKPKSVSELTLVSILFFF